MEIIDDTKNPKPMKGEGSTTEEEEEILGPTLDELCADPEIIALFDDEETNQAFIEIDEDPKTIAHHQNNPKVQNVLKVIFRKLEPWLPKSQTPPMPPPGAMNSMEGLMQHLRMQSQNSGTEDPLALFSQLPGHTGAGVDLQGLMQQLTSMGGMGRHRKNTGLLTQ